MPYSVSLTTRNTLNPEPQLGNLWATKLGKKKGGGLPLKEGSKLRLPDLPPKSFCYFKGAPPALVGTSKSSDSINLSSCGFLFSEFFLPNRCTERR
jgi:hypothetical protein